MKVSTEPVQRRFFDLRYHSIRNISSPEDTENSRLVYVGQAPIESLVDLPTDENVRGYLVEAEGKQKRTPTKVHLAIRETLHERPDQFCVLNGGVVIVARGVEVDDKAKTVRLKDPSIINGSQTQGEIKAFLQENVSDDAIHVKYELIVTEDDGLVAEISIARNFQNDVQSISIAGARGQLDELEERVKKKFPSYRLQKSETQRPGGGTEYLQTEKLLQVIAALLPDTLWWKSSDYSKVYTYSQKATCLKDFQRIYEITHYGESQDKKRFKPVYDFYLDIAPSAWELYERWKSHQGFAGTGLRAIERDGREIVEVPDGIIFPILAAHAQFVVKEKNEWRLKPPAKFDDKELIRAAKSAYQEIARSRPEIMGKSKPCYTAVEQITQIYKRLLGS